LTTIIMRHEDEAATHRNEAAGHDTSDPSWASATDLSWASARAGELIRFLDRYRPLGSALIKAFFVEDHWNTKIPCEWHASLEWAAPDQRRRSMLLSQSS